MICGDFRQQKGPPSRASLPLKNKKQCCLSPKRTALLRVAGHPWKMASGKSLQQQRVYPGPRQLQPLFVAAAASLDSASWAAAPLLWPGCQGRGWSWNVKTWSCVGAGALGFEWRQASRRWRLLGIPCPGRAIRMGPGSAQAMDEGCCYGVGFRLPLGRPQG